jgi:DNA-binding PadR family transcriptional regulator
MRSTLELLLLSLLQDGIATPYELKSRADISLGSSIPALARLEADGLIEASDPQPRRSRRFTLKTKGRTALKKDWSEHLQSSTTDVESILRIAYLAFLNKSSAKAAVFLEAAADRLRGLATMAHAESTRFDRRGAKVDNEELRWLRARVDERRVKAEAQELSALAQEVKKRSTGRRRNSLRDKIKIRKYNMQQ